MITIFQPPPVWGLPSMSPFCVKLETYLRMAGLAYKNAAGNPMLAPKGKIPYVEIGGKRMGDSSLIIAYLKQTKGDPLDARLSPAQKDQALLLQRMLEDHLYFGTAWLRWTGEESLREVRAAFLSFLPPMIGGLIFSKLRKNFLRALKEQGMGRHTEEEILAFVREDLELLSRQLGKNDYFFGNEPSSIDATIYGFLVQLLWVPWKSPVTELARSLPNLEAFCQRMKKRYWAS